MEDHKYHVSPGVLMSLYGHPRFLDVSDRQLQEALSLVSVELVPSFTEGVPDPEEVVRRVHLMQAVNYIRTRLPELLGF